MTPRQKALDMLERAAWTYLQAFLAAWAMTGFSFTKGAIIGALAAALSVLKTWAKQTVG